MNKFNSIKNKFITIDNLGEARIGNQMFQFASLKGIAKNIGCEISLPPENDNITLYKCFKNTLKYSNSKKNLPNYNSFHEFEFDENFYNHCPPNHNVYGYFQTEKYFNNIRQDIKNDFQFDETIQNICQIYKDEVFGDEEIISLHIRRTDYVTDPNLKLLSLDYYKNALNLLNSSLSVIVFSDDISWCEEQELFQSKRFRISKTKNAFIDMCLMTLCDYHIIANSSFSWWGAWLSNSKKVIAPSEWFCETSNLYSYKLNDLYCPDWIVI